MIDAVLRELIDSDSRPMVAAALQILAALAADPEHRDGILGPWAWDLRQRARRLEKAGCIAASEQAKVIARVVSAVALGEVSSEELSRAARGIDADVEQTRIAADVLASAMRAERRVTSSA